MNAVPRIWVQVRTSKDGAWQNRIAAPLRDAREHVKRLASIIGAENVRVDPEREAKIATELGVR